MVHTPPPPPHPSFLFLGIILFVARGGKYVDYLEARFFAVRYFDPFDPDKRKTGEIMSVDLRGVWMWNYNPINT